MKYRIYYGDGSTYGGDPFRNPGAEFFAPATNVQVVAYEASDAARGFKLQQGSDYYVWRRGRFEGCDIGGLWDYLLMHEGPKAVLAGRSLRDEDFFATVKRASEEGIG